MLAGLACLSARPSFANAGEAEARKARSIAQLQREGVPVLDSLPVIATEAESTRRSLQEVVGRTAALIVVSVTGETGKAALAQSLTEQFGAREFLSPAEAAFLADPLADPQRRADFTWRYEGLAVMLWALGLADLPRPDRLVDVPALAGMLKGTDHDGLLRDARPRPQAEILDANDLHYRYNWAVVQARIDGQPAPAGLDPDVVYERHYALNWLIGYAGQTWDGITTDT